MEQAVEFRSRIVTVEPIGLFLSLAATLVGPSYMQFLRQVTCDARYNSSLCQLILANQSHYRIETAVVNSDASKFHVYAMLLADMPAIITAWFFGSWADQVSRKLVLYVAVASACLQSTLSYFVMTFPNFFPYQLILLPFAISGLTGGGSCAIYVASSYIGQLADIKQRADDEDESSALITDFTTTRITKMHRVSRYSVYQSMLFFGSAIGGCLSGLILQQSGLIGCCHAIAACLSLLTLLYMFVWVIDLLPQAKDSNRRLLSPWYLLKPVGTVFSVQNKARKQALLALVGMLLYAIGASAMSSVYYLFLTSPPIDLSPTVFGYFSFGMNFSAALVVLLVLPLIKWMFPTINDAAFALMGLLSQAYAQMALAFASSMQEAFVLLVPMALKVWVYAALESCLSSCVASGEQGAYFAAVNSANRLLNIPSMLLFAYWIYPSTDEYFPGLVLIVGAVVLLLAAATVVYLIRISRSDAATMHN